MTHGPCFQVIAGLSRIGDRQIEAYLSVPGQAGVFASVAEPKWLVNPMLMDACAQLVGYWAQHELPERFITFPAGVQRIRLFSPPPEADDLLRC